MEIYIHTYTHIWHLHALARVKQCLDVLIYLFYFKCLCYEGRGSVRERGTRHILSFSPIVLAPFVSSFLPPAPSSLCPLPPASKSWCWTLRCVSALRLLLAFKQQGTISSLFLYSAWCFAASYTGRHLLPCFSWSLYQCCLHCRPSGYTTWCSAVQELNILFKHPETEIIRMSDSLGFFVGSKTCGVDTITWTSYPASVLLQCLWQAGEVLWAQYLVMTFLRPCTFLTGNRFCIKLP